MTTESAQKRPLSSLSTEECQTLFALAFGYAPPATKLKIFSLGGHYPLTIQDGSFSLILYWDGSLIVQRQNELSAKLNVRKLIDQLDMLNIQFGPEDEATPSTPVQP